MNLSDLNSIPIKRQRRKRVGRGLPVLPREHQVAEPERQAVDQAGGGAVAVAQGAREVQRRADGAPFGAPAGLMAGDAVGQALAGAQHVIKGSSWAHGTVTQLRFAFRDFSDRKRDDVGFRLARYAQ